MRCGRSAPRHGVGQDCARKLRREHRNETRPSRFESNALNTVGTLGTPIRAPPPHIRCACRYGCRCACRYGCRRFSRLLRICLLGSIFLKYREPDFRVGQARSFCRLSRVTRCHRNRMCNYVRNAARERKRVSGQSRGESGCRRQDDHDLTYRDTPSDAAGVHSMMLRLLIEHPHSCRSAGARPSLLTAVSIERATSVIAVRAVTAVIVIVSEGHGQAAAPVMACSNRPASKPPPKRPPAMAPPKCPPPMLSPPWPPAATASVAMTALPNATATTTMAILCNVGFLIAATSVPNDSMMSLRGRRQRNRAMSGGGCIYRL